MGMYVKMDERNRVTLPKEAAQLFKNGGVEIRVEKERVILKPAPTWDEMFGSLPKLDMNAFAKQHQEDAE